MYAMHVIPSQSLQHVNSGKIIDNVMFNNYFVSSEFWHLPQGSPVFLGIRLPEGYKTVGQSYKLKILIKVSAICLGFLKELQT